MAIAVVVALTSAGTGHIAAASQPPTQVAAASASGHALATGVSPDAPNVLVIVSDDQPTDSVSDLRQYMPHTVDLMEQGTSYPNASVIYPLCCPSRATGMSGRYPHNTGVTDLESGSKLDSTTTIQYALRQQGYNTAIVGKYLQGIKNDVKPPHFSCRTTWLNPNYYNFTANVDGRLARIDRYATSYSGDRVRHCLKGFEATDDKPWYTYWAPHAPHKSSAYHGTAQPERKYRDADVPGCVAPGERDMKDKLPYLRHRMPSLTKVRRFCMNSERALMTLDDEISKVRGWLRRHDEQNTLIIYWSDNGVLTGQHNRIGKTVPYLPSIKVPMFMTWPGHVQAGVDERLATNADLAPTILAAVGTPALTVEDGHSWLTGSQSSVQYSESFIVKDGRTDLPQWFQLLKPGDWAYIEDDLPTGRVFREYYDLSTDPAQNRNLLADDDPSNNPSADLLSALHAQLSLARTCAGTQEQGSVNPCP